MAFRTSVRLQLLSLLLGLSSMNNAGAGAQEFQLLQPQGAVSVSAGETLTLPCSVTGNPPTGPTKWFKGSGPTRQLVYEDKDSAKGSFPRVTRVANTDSDFTIRISDTRPEDAGTYRCVKFKKGLKGDEEIGSGAGTAVSVSTKDPISSFSHSLRLGTHVPLIVHHNPQIFYTVPACQHPVPPRVSLGSCFVPRCIYLHLAMLKSSIYLCPAYQLS
ncbi:tyrosine-protein phosphatase non-receptor type substrate 1-like isoform X4 [Pelodiscus sinensis]|uniref:tyrosine-protein phosphatase non-receptor type substrate 1-like isoform X4 n=1 Tax=Pelodiscus sinensis TaxID=13735 RepID=UPI003F6D34C9